jgi:hypothetical protein
MSEYYNAHKTTGIYSPGQSQQFRISRSKIELFTECPKCFYRECRLGIGRPPGYPFSLNSAVDHLLKQEFDVYRANGSKHPLIEKYGIDARPIAHKDLDKWRYNFTGVQYLHEATNFLVFGAIDDLWENSKGEYIVVDYKATSKNKDIIELDEDWQDGYKRQMEIYQWLLRNNGYKVSNTGYFVYCNGKKDAKAFDAKLEFKVTLIPYTGNSDWVENTILDIHKCLNSNKIPESSTDCDYCAYLTAVSESKI